MLSFLYIYVTTSLSKFESVDGNIWKWMCYAYKFYKKDQESADIANKRAIELGITQKDINEILIE